jgi:hypothetical protein
MSGRSGYRKTDRKLNRNATPAPKSDYVLRFQLPHSLAFAVSPGAHNWAVTIGFNDVVFCSGQNPAHCAQLAADFLDRIGARQHPQSIVAKVVKLLPCSAHCPPPRREGFNKIGSAIDLEAIHDRVSRFAERARECAININADSITFVGATPKHLIHDYSDERRSHRSRA